MLLIPGEFEKIKGNLMNKRIAALFLLFFFSAAVSLAQGIDDKEYKRRVKDLDTSSRILRLHPSRIIEAIKIKPGMTIADIGAGTGLFALYLSDALKNTGMVFATDIDKNMLEHIKNKIREGNYANITPVLVGQDSNDPFYQQHSFDIVFLSAVYEELADPQDYFRKLRPSLKKNGQLYIHTLKPDYDIIELILSELPKAIHALFSKGEDFPVFKKLSKENQDFIRNWASSQENPGLPDEIRARIQHDLKRILYDRTLFNSIYTYYKKEASVFPGSCLYYLYPKSFALIKWLVMQLGERGILEDEDIPLTQEDKNTLCALNTRLLLEIFNLPEFPTFHPRKESIVRTLEKAGYELTQDYDLSAAHYFLEFKRKY